MSAKTTSSASRIRTAAPDVLIDVRALQADPGAWFGLLRRGRDALPDAHLIGLADPDLPPLDGPSRACLDAVRPSAYGPADAFVRLGPGQHDELFTARLLQRGVPSVATKPRPRDAIARYWLARTDHIAAPDAVWELVSRLPPPRSRAARTAILTRSPNAPACLALQAEGGAVFGPETLPILSAEFDRLVFVLANTAGDGELIRLLRRYGGEAVVTESCLLAAYSPEHARLLAERELRRPVPRSEVEQWRDGIARPPALFLAEVAAAAASITVHAAWLQREMEARYGCRAALWPIPIRNSASPPRRLRAHAAGLQAEACVWALEMLRDWGHALDLGLVCPAAEQPGLRALAERLGVGDAVAFEPGAEGLPLLLAMRGQASLAALLAGASFPCIVSQSVAEAVDPPVRATIVPDQPSPPLLAEAIRANLYP